jgi:uncharacterized protein involved in high-affinity Fe2+ transport
MRAWMLAPAAALSVLALAGCGSSVGLTQTATTAAKSAGTGASASVPEVNGVKPVPSQTLATADWQGMKIQARTMTPIPFYIYNGTKMQEVKPGRHASFHLMVMLNDAHTNEPIPYATVWATIRKAGKVVYDERQWPMLSAYMGPHYGNDVTLPGAGHYQLSLLVSPPVSARHVEYKGVWLKPHRVTMSFHWQPPK